ncbi:MAG: crossover junction endodeoxyribonuclease RuvC [bacterium]|nr:crossover junction endodeoxyribonuclease RuvC [bacterium]
MHILGIDCGLSATGYAILRDGCVASNGIIKTDKDNSLASRINTIYLGIKEVVDREKPDLTVIESLFFGKNLKTLISLAHARGVILLATHNTRIYEVTPAEVKKTVTGNGRASKQQVRYMVERLINIPHGVSEHIVDACACALWGQWKIEQS